jgi:hypothetical protein
LISFGKVILEVLIPTEKDLQLVISNIVMPELSASIPELFEPGRKDINKKYIIKGETVKMVSDV